MTADVWRDRWMVAVGLIVAFALVLGGCGGADEADDGALAGTDQASLEDDEAPTYGGTVVFGLPAETKGWNPAVDQWADAGNFVGSTMFDPLAVFNADGTTEPYLAESIEPVEGAEFTEWTITLPDGVAYHDGTALTAETVARNLDFVFNDDASLTKIALTGLVESIEATGPLEVTARFTSPWSAFPGSLAGTVGYMMAPAMLDAEGLGSRDPVGTGPYEFEQWSPDNSLDVVKNDEYWQEGPPYLDRITFQVVKDDQTRAEGIRSGQLDIMLTNSPTSIEKLAETNTVVRDFDTEQTFAMFNTAVPPFDNEHARKALALATDRDALVAEVGPGVETSDSPFPSRTAWSVDDPGWVDHDPDAARAELEAYLADTGESELSFTFSGMTGIDVQHVMQILQAQWAAVGISADIDVIDQTTYVGTTILGDFQLAFFRNYGYPEPDSDVVFWHSSSANGPGALSINFTQYTTPEIDAALEAARATDDIEERKALYTEVVRARNAAVVDLWLYKSPAALVANSRVRGLAEFGAQGFANYVPKPWVNDLWIRHDD